MHELIEIIGFAYITWACCMNERLHYASWGLITEGANEWQAARSELRVQRAGKVHYALSVDTNVYTLSGVKQRLRVRPLITYASM